MENEAGFSIENALAAWRKDLRRTGSVTPEQTRELEIHLRETFSTLRQQGLREDEAFLIARRRLGGTHDLAAEFEKLNRRGVSGPSSIYWKVFAWSCFALALLFFFLGCSTLSYGGERFHARIPISDAFADAVQGGIRGWAAPFFLPAICVAAFLVIVFFRSAGNRFSRVLIICAGLAIGASGVVQDIRHGVWQAFITLVPLYLLRVPLETARVLAGGGDGEFYQDSLVLGLTIGWWLVLWATLALRELWAWAAGLIRPRGIDLAPA